MDTESLIHNLPLQRLSIGEEIDQQFWNFWDTAFAEADDGDLECSDSFNRILADVASFTNDAIPRLEADPSKALVCAVVLARIFDSPQMDGRKCGWDGLNLDAKGFCFNLIQCLPKAGQSTENLELLLTAKSVVGNLLLEKPLDCSKPRCAKPRDPRSIKSNAFNGDHDG